MFFFRHENGIGSEKRVSIGIHMSRNSQGRSYLKVREYIIGILKKSGEIEIVIP